MKWEKCAVKVDYTGKIVVLTGAAGGIGSRIAGRFDRLCRTVYAYALLCAAGCFSERRPESFAGLALGAFQRQ